MSTRRYRQMVEDRNLRDAALALVKADIEHLRSDVSVKGVGERLADRASEGALDVFEEAAEAAENNRGILATLLAAVVIWFARNPIMALFEDDDDDHAEENISDEDIGDDEFGTEDELDEPADLAEPPAR